MTDRYRNFADLAAKNQEGTHYRVTTRDRGSKFLVAAPHGGQTEPHTSPIAKAIAGARHSFYAFEGLVPRLHITSSHFDEPRALGLAQRHSTVLTVHGCTDARSRTMDVFVGGLDTNLRDSIIEELRRAGFAATIDTGAAGRSRTNLCNRGRSRLGIQLEITRRLRDGLVDESANQRAFVRAVRCALARYLTV